MPLLDTVLSVVAPHECLLCKAEGNIICDWCLPDAFSELPSRCYRCQQLTIGFAVCAGCKKRASLQHVWIRTEYAASAKELLKLYKYERARSAQDIIATAMDEVLPYLSPDTLIVPVPTATGRIRQRGYDQVVLLARILAQKRSLLWIQAVAHHTQSRQVGASRHQRQAQLARTFVVTRQKNIKNADIVLIDDVLTTGATIETISRILKEAGARSVSALLFAQKH